MHTHMHRPTYQYSLCSMGILKITSLANKSSGSFTGFVYLTDSLPVHPETFTCSCVKLKNTPQLIIICHPGLKTSDFHDLLCLIILTKEISGGT